MQTDAGIAAISSPVAVAQFVGEHALAFYSLSLLIAMLLAGGGVWIGHRRDARTSTAVPQTGATVPSLLPALAIGFALMLGAASLFAAIASRLGPEGAMGQADQALADAIARHTPQLALNAFALLTHFGDPIWLIAIAIAVAVWLWRRNARLLATGWVLALGGNAVLNPLLKVIFARVRPVHDHGLVQATGFSFPSGHSSGAMVVYGMLLYLGLRLLPARWHGVLAMGLAALILTTGWSRIYLRVHFASDVAAGLLSGLCWLGVCIAALEFAHHRHARRSTRPRVG